MVLVERLAAYFVERHTQTLVRLVELGERQFGELAPRGAHLAVDAALEFAEGLFALLGERRVVLDLFVETHVEGQ